MSQSSALTIIEPYTKYTKIVPGNKGIVVADEIPFDAFCEAVRVQGNIIADGLWGLGDLLLAGERIFGEKHAQALDNTKYSEKMVNNAMWVCRTFPPETRHKELTFSHHHAVAGVKDLPLREEILTKAEENEWPVTRVTEERQKRVVSKRQNTRKSLTEAAGRLQSQKEGKDSPRQIISEEEALQAMDEVALYLTQVKESGKEMSCGKVKAMDEKLKLIMKVARSLNLIGGQRSGGRKGKKK